MNSPKISFNKNNHAWTFIYFSDAFDFLNNKAISRGELNYKEGAVKCIHYGDILTKFHQILDSSSPLLPYINDDVDVEKVSSLKTGDIVIADTAEDYAVGKSIEVSITDDSKVIAGLHTMSCRPKKNFASGFLGYYLNSTAYHGQLRRLVTGTKVYAINKSEIRKTNLHFPGVEEQQKIAAFLTALDEKILLIDKTIASLNDLKRGLMDRLFKRRVRFNGKDGTTFGKWRLSTIGAEGTFYYGKSAPKWSLSDTATTPCIRYGDLYTKHEYVVKDVDTYTEIEREKLVFSKGGEVLVPRVGEDPLDFCKCAYLPMKNIAIGEMISVYETDNDGLYISYYFNSQMKKTFAKYVEGGNVSNLYYTYLEGIELEVPTIDEQKRISDFLSVLIEKIDVNKNKKEKYVTLKRAFMQQMFV